MSGLQFWATIRSTTLTFLRHCTLLGLAALCSCAHQPIAPAASKLPADQLMEKDAGRGSWLFVTVRLENGQKLPFFLDTGASGTCFDKSFEPILGKRVATDTSWHFGGKSEAGIYQAPKLYLGGALLKMTGTNVATIDLNQMTEEGVGRPIAGVLGMDILQHYCIQLDFDAKRIRFLDSEHAEKSSWGKPFTLSGSGDDFPLINTNLLGCGGPASLIDTGCNNDGWLTPILFNLWTNQNTSPGSPHARSSEAWFDGEKYPGTDFDWLEESAVSSDDSHMKYNGIGLRFLSRHLVTFDFPNRTLYLKRTLTGPPSLSTKEVTAEGKSACKYLVGLKKKGELPGWSAGNEFASRMATFHYYTLNSGTTDFTKAGDSCTYHYYVVRISEHSSWRLSKAWRSDSSGRAIEHYATRESSKGINSPSAPRASGSAGGIH